MTNEQHRQALELISKHPEMVRIYENQLKEYASRNDDAIHSLQHATFAFINEAYRISEERGLLNDKWND